MTNKQKTVQSVNRLNAMYLQMREEKEEKARKFKLNLGVALTATAILGILVTIL